MKKRTFDSRARCIPPFTAVSTGIHRYTVTGCWCAAAAIPRSTGTEGEIRAPPTTENTDRQSLKAEADTFSRPLGQSFERPYGWAWLLKLAEELQGWDDPDGKDWSRNLQPLTDTIVDRYLAYFPKQTYPIRSGVHSSTAFGLTFALDYARAVGNNKLCELVEERSRFYFGSDAGIPAAWEPDGADFFSPSLMEADLMRRVLPKSQSFPQVG